jgi:hypothetical protein
MNVYALDCAPSNATAGSVSASASPGAGAIVINGTLASGGVATLGAAQNVTLVSGGNDTGITFTVIGTDADGAALSETLAGASGGTATTAGYFKTITSSTHTGSVATTLSAGNAVTSVSPTFKFYRQVSPARIAVGISLVSGTSTYTMQDNFTNAPHTLWMDNATVTGKSASFEYAYIDTPCMAARLRVTASTLGVLQANFVIAKA